MQVHASYSIHLAEMGSNRDEIQEIAARRAAEVRRRLATLALTPIQADDAVALVKAVAAPESDPPIDAYSADAYSATEAPQIPAGQPLGQDPNPIPDQIQQHIPQQIQQQAIQAPATHRDPGITKSLFSALA